MNWSICVKMTLRAVGQSCDCPYSTLTMKSMGESFFETTWKLNKHNKTMHNKIDLRLVTGWHVVIIIKVTVHLRHPFNYDKWPPQFHWLHLHNSYCSKWVSKRLILLPNNIARWCQQKDVGTVGQIASSGAVKYKEKPTTIGNNIYLEYWELFWC